MPPKLITWDALCLVSLHPHSLCPESPIKAHLKSVPLPPLGHKAFSSPAASSLCPKHVLVVTPLFRKLWVLTGVGLYFHTTFVASSFHTSLLIFNSLWCCDFVYDDFNVYDLNFYVIRPLELLRSKTCRPLFCLTNPSGKLVGWIRMQLLLLPQSRQRQEGENKGIISPSPRKRSKRMDEPSSPVQLFLFLAPS